MGDEVVYGWAEGEVRIETDPQATGVSFEWEGRVVENNLWCNSVVWQQCSLWRLGVCEVVCVGGDRSVGMLSRRS